MFDISEVEVSLGGRNVLGRVSATLGPGPVAITGPSGSGKTTLLRVLAGHLVPDAGKVSLNGQTVKASAWRRASDPRIAYVYQDYRLVPFLSALENLLLAAEVRGIVPEKGAAMAALARVGLEESFADRKPSTLSGGEQQRVAIARALVCRAEAVIADEPTGALDSANSLQVAELLVALGVANDVQVVVATHDPVVADMLPQRLVLEAGALQVRQS